LAASYFEEYADRAVEGDLFVDYPRLRVEETSVGSMGN
jgi:hypothetical protein